MPDEAVFIQTIREHPDDDGPRLVYADWLEEHGECDRAEFIRVQIELARGVEDTIRREQLAEREQVLLKKPITQWVRRHFRWVGRWHFHRGTLNYVNVRASDYFHRGQKLFDLAPIMQVSVRHLNGNIEALAQSQYLRLFRVLDLCDNAIQAREVSALLESPYLGHLHELNLQTNQIGNMGARAIFSSRNLSRLQRLVLADNGITGGDWLAPRSPLRKLVELDLQSNALGDAGAMVIARSAISKSLQELNLAHCQIGPEGAQSLSTSKCFLHLTELQLFGNAIEDAGAESLANSSLLGGIEQLGLSYANIGWRGARALAQSQLMTGLRLLDLCGNRLNSRQKNRLELRFGSRVKF